MFYFKLVHINFLGGYSVVTLLDIVLRRLNDFGHAYSRRFKELKGRVPRYSGNLRVCWLLFVWEIVARYTVKLLTKGNLVFGE